MRRSVVLRSLALGAVVAMSLAACAGEPESTDGEPAASFASLDEVCAAAEAEDTMEAWLNFGDPEAILAAFNEAYPDVDVEVLPIVAEDSVPRIVTESVSGQAPTASVVYGNLPNFAPLINRDLLNEEIDWASIGVDPELISPLGTVRVAHVAYGVGYNTDKYSEDDLPDTWEGFLDPEWSGKLIVDPRGRPFSFIAIEWGQEKAVEYVKEVMTDLNPIVIQGTSAGLLAVASGEGDILFNSKTAETTEQVEAGAPLGIKLMDIVPVEGTQLGILNDAPQPLAGQCFVGWASSAEGSEVILEVEYKANSLPPAPEGAIYVETRTEEDLAVSDATIEELSKIITGGQG